ncbi:LTXXQ motif family protein [Desulfurella multipotens]|uniref:LTXXQ motif family protein n=1 Tax=Desulfurella multipotens TaxID=79269 RepID=A0A1G6N5N8_9BACT|nr:Spy/CpxP family protein refolding chaperone [Desulfurella multipotens]SDC63178.1 LTXXQ motif family protein [Desulfurella multipotens]
MHYKKFFVGLIFSGGLMLAVSNNSFAQPQAGYMMNQGYGMMGGFMGPYQFKYLNLTKQQQNEVRKLQEQHSEAMQNIMKEYFNAMNNSSGNETVNQMAQIRSECFNKMMNERNAYFNALSKILTKEQMEKLHSAYQAPVNK